MNTIVTQSHCRPSLFQNVEARILFHSIILAGVLAFDSALAQTNIAPEITGQAALSTLQDTPLEIRFEDLQVTDPDDTYPAGFTMELVDGDNYSVSGMTVIPDAGFAGTLSIPVTVNDGETSSAPFNLEVTVTAANVKPTITGQIPLSTIEGQSITIALNDISVDDPDDPYPSGFTMNIQAGANYTVSGQTITPDAGFVGTLNVIITVNDGEIDSDPFTLTITVNAQEPVNVPPTITGQNPLSTQEETPITVDFVDLTVNDPDDTYPDGFTMSLSAGANYTVNGRTVTPNAGFTGTLTVPVTVNDGEATSDPFQLSISVTEAPVENVKPVITGQVELKTEEGKAIKIELADLTVTDPDNSYPSDFTLSLQDGPNYSVNNANVIPNAGFTGTLTVPVTVNDGQESSDPFNLIITVEPIPEKNKKPTIIGQTPLSMLNSETLTISLNNLFVSDPDDPYPTGFSLTLFPGSGYTLSGNTVKPLAGFTGTLTVKVTVSDGKDDSDPFNLKITVTAPPANVTPVITGQQELTTFRNTALTLKLSNLIVSDPDDTYPTGFSLEVLPGSNYTVSGSIIRPVNDFIGTLTVGVRVHDGTDWSNPFYLTVSVVEKDELRITGQDEIIIAEDSTFSLNTDLLVVNDPSGSYPNGFTINISPGENYTAEGSRITPESDFNGSLEVSVQVVNGSTSSNVFRLVILVTPVNDAPFFDLFNAGVIPYSPGDGAVSVAGEETIVDVDNDQLVFAEIFIDQEDFNPGKDALSGISTENIRTVFDPNTGVLVLLGLASLSEYQSVIQGVSYTYSNDTLPEPRSKNIRFRLNDGQDFGQVYSKAIEFREMITLDIPNVFSPNDDRANDTWVISRQNQSERTSVTIRVFDKRGQIVYESNSVEEEWDGRFKGENLPADTYFYTIEIKSQSNSTSRKGVLTILR
jgi:gliding motility-associated-like protein